VTPAAGVAGGVMLASALGGLFGSSEAKAEEPAADEPAATDAPDESAMDDGGDFDTFGDF